MPKRNLTQAVKSLRSAIGSKPRYFCFFDDDLTTVCNLFCEIFISWLVLLGTVKIPAIIRDNDAQAAANEQPHDVWDNVICVWCSLLGLRSLTVKGLLLDIRASVLSRWSCYQGL